jgi:hypothetical protein
MEPFEIIAAPVTAWWAPVGTAFPDIGAEPASAWELIGKSGNRNITEDGVTVQHGQSIQEHRTAGSTGPVKATRDEESLVVSFSLADLRAEMYRLGLNNNAIDDGTAGQKKISMHRGIQVAQLALLIRGPSPYIADGISQYQVPRVYVGENQEITFSKGDLAGMSFEFHAIEDGTDDPFGHLIVQNGS